jgi:RecB family exonuclease
VITPRRTRLLRAPDLSGFRSHLVALAAGLDAAAAADTFVIVPTRAAGEQLRRTLAARGRLPHIGTRGDFHDLLASRLARRPRMLSPFEREALLGAAARDAEESGAAPPFHVRPALVAEMIGLYDQIRRLHRTVDDFDRLLCGELEPAAESDRGAAQLLEQTRFLVAAFRGYEARLRDGGGSDEHALRLDLIATPAATPITHVAVTVGDRLSDPEGLWPADVALLTSMSGLENVDILATDGVLAAGYLERLRLAFVGIEEAAPEDEEPASPKPFGEGRAIPVLVVPPPVNHHQSLLQLGGDDASPPPRSGQVVFSYRDREEELEGVARRLKADRRAGREVRLDRTALVVSHALPYLYVARDVFAGAGVPFQTLDTLPLAAEPYAAALDLVIEFVATGFTRRATTALLRSPHFRLETLDRASISALDAALVERRFLGGLDRLIALANEWVASAKATADQGSSPRGGGRERRRQQAALPAATTAIELATFLAPLNENRPLLEHLELLLSFLNRYERASEDERRQRGRAGVLAAITGLVDGYRRHDPGASGTVHDLSAAIRRWLGAQTFALRSGEGGLQIVDAQAARYGEFDDVQLMGLVEGEWPERPRRSVFYPQALLAQLEPPRPDRVAIHEERDLLRAARASFRDLTLLARSRTRLSTFALEADAVVEPSVFVEDAAGFGLATETAIGHEDARVFIYEALQGVDRPTGVALSAFTERWATARRSRGDSDPTRFLGQAGEWTLPRVSVSRLERYLKCPFQFYVSNVLQIDEEREDEDTRSPLERGRFLHELFETFFHEWQARGHSRITPETIGDAEALFAEVCGPALASLAPSEAELERARLFGSAVGPGMASRVFAMEAERDAGIDERLMEYELDGEFTFVGGDGAARTVPLRAKIDRVDVLSDGTFRLIDYKTKYVPDLKTALQLPIYSACVRARLSRERGRDIPASEAMYLSFEGKRGVVALERKGVSFAELVTDAEHRLVGALNDIAAGHFPARPETRSLCTMCAFVTICRTPGGADLPEAEVE